MSDSYISIPAEKLLTMTAAAIERIKELRAAAKDNVVKFFVDKDRRSWLRILALQPRITYDAAAAHLEACAAEWDHTVPMVYWQYSRASLRRSDEMSVARRLRNLARYGDPVNVSGSDLEAITVDLGIKPPIAG